MQNTYKHNKQSKYTPLVLNNLSRLDMPFCKKLNPAVLPLTGSLKTCNFYLHSLIDINVNYAQLNASYRSMF